MTEVNAINSPSASGTSKTIGGGLIIAGTSIGAGMLSIPIVSMELGFITATIIMFAFWALMTYTSLLMLEVHQYADSKATLHTLAKQFLGEKGKYIAAFSMFFLFYSLCAAYTAGGGAQLSDRINGLVGMTLPPAVGSIGFCILIATIVAAGTHLVDKINRILFGLMMVAMVTVLMFLVPNISSTYLAEGSFGYGLVLVSLPVVFTSFGFHGSIPAIVSYLDGDTKNLKKAMYIGSCLPLTIYVLWLMCTLGVVSQGELTSSPTLNVLISALASTLTSSSFSFIIGIFADLALMTSFLGVSLGLFEFVRDTTQNKLKGNKVLVAMITYFPPLCFALFYPQGFIMALGYAAVALVVLAVFLPVAMTIKSREINKETGKYRVAGGKPLMVMSVVFGVVIILAQIFAS